MLMKRFLLCMLALWLCLLPPLAEAQGPVSVIGNVPGTPAFVNALASNNWWADGFALSPAADAYALQRVVLTVSQGVANDVFAALYANAAGQPGALLMALTPQVPVGALADYVFLPNAPVNLLPGNSYWLVVSGGQPFPSGTGRWALASAPMTTAPGVSFAGARRSEDLGATWLNAFGTTHGFGVEGVVVPEPGSAALAALGGWALLGRRVGGARGRA